MCLARTKVHTIRKRLIDFNWGINLLRSTYIIIDLTYYAIGKQTIERYDNREGCVIEDR